MAYTGSADARRLVFRKDIDKMKSLHERMKDAAKGGLAKICVCALAGCAACSAFGNDATVSGKATKMTNQDARSLMAASVISAAMSSNFNYIAKIMTPDARRDWSEFCSRVKIEDDQYFMPDFCKVKYVMVGARDEVGFVAGFYNPFFDAFVLLLVDGDEKPSVSGFRFATRARLGGVAEDAEFPLASGQNPSENYFPAVLQQSRVAARTFSTAFCRPDFRDVFKKVAAPDDGEIARLTRIMKFRIGQALKLAEDKRVLRDAAVANAILANSSLHDGKFVAKDASTRTTLAAVSGAMAPFQESFRAVAYFPDGDSSNVVFFSRHVPTALVQATVGNDCVVSFKLFDAHLIGSEEMANN